MSTNHKRKSDGSLPAPKRHRHSNGNNDGHCPQQHHHTKFHKTPISTPLQPVKYPDLPSISPSLAAKVFTHSSVYSNSKTINVVNTYDRLEFLGDAYLEVIASRLLWGLFPDGSSGKLSSLRELLVKNETLAVFSRAYGFDKQLKFGGDVAVTAGPSSMMKIHGDVFEAYVAAVVLSDGERGFADVEEWLTALWMPLLRGVKTETVELKWKSELAKLIMAPGVRINYVEEKRVAQKGKGLETYFMGVYLTGWGFENQLLGRGSGLNKVTAGDEAAKAATENKDIISQAVRKRQEWLRTREEQRKVNEANGVGP